MKLPCHFFCPIWLCLALGASAASTDSLEKGFLNPPDSAKPQTWWHWMNGNITKEGINADLEAMKQIGLGGATIVNVDCGIPRGAVPFMSAEWREDFKFAVQRANQLGLQLCVENCAGWSSSGGPWNTVTNAMQRLTSSETRAKGPAAFDAVLPQPPVTRGYYRDIAVLAFKAPPDEAHPAPGPASAPGKLEIKRAVYGPEDGGGSADVTAKLVALVKSGQKSIVVGNNVMGGDPAFGQVKQLHVDFTLDGKPGAATVDEGETLLFPVNASQLAAARPLGRSSLSRTFVQPPPASGRRRRRSHSARRYAGFDGEPCGWRPAPVGRAAGQLDHSASRLHADRREQSSRAQGRQRAWSATSSARPRSTRIGRASCKRSSMTSARSPARRSTRSLIDSYEVGGQNWTANFREEFQKRRGYDLLKFLPAFTGRVVDNPAVSERFLWDVRRTIADLFAENYYGHFAELCRQHGLMNAVEPYTGPFESLQCGAPADVVMGEFWSGSQGHPSVKLAASIAHIYGKTIVGAESFTASPEHGRWQNDPYSLKTLGDLMFCQGLNRCIFHRYAMQPWTNRWPGMTMGQWGFHFERTVTWWQQGKAWIELPYALPVSAATGPRRGGRRVFYRRKCAAWKCAPAIQRCPPATITTPINADVLLHGATVKNGRITLASGASYAVLILPPDGLRIMTPQLLQCIARTGARRGDGGRPAPATFARASPDYPKCDAQVKKTADELWGKCDGKNVTENS